MSITGHITASSVRLAWRADAHTGSGLALLILVAFAVGSTLMARPFVRRRTTLLIGVPVAAVLRVFALGIFALVVAAVLAGWLDFLDVFDSASGSRQTRRRQAQSDPPDVH